jgi:hypothetical protein
VPTPRAATERPPITGSFPTPDEGSCAAFALALGAANYGRADIERIAKVLAEVISPMAAQAVPAASVLNYRVSPSDVRVEIIGHFIDRIVMRKESDVVWARYLSGGSRRSALFYRVVH